ncbi:MAG: hypothetical protein ABWZ52_09390 [Acidimicrobiales bacterium]
MAAGKPPSNVGCVLALVALPLVILIGVIIGTVLRRDDDVTEEQHVTLDQGEIAGTAWRIDAVRDVEGETCIFLYEDDAVDPLNGSCDLQPQDVTYGDETVVFGRADGEAIEVAVEVQRQEAVDPESVMIDTVTADGMDGRFYVAVVDGDLDAIALIT